MNSPAKPLMFRRPKPRRNTYVLDTANVLVLEDFKRTLGET